MGEGLLAFVFLLATLYCMATIWVFFYLPSAYVHTVANNHTDEQVRGFGVLIAGLAMAHSYIGCGLALYAYLKGLDTYAWVFFLVYAAVLWFLLMMLKAGEFELRKIYKEEEEHDGQN